MSNDIERARIQVLVVWISLFSPLAILITLQTAFKKYDWTVGWGWLGQATIPTLSLMISVIGTRSVSKEAEKTTPNRTLYLLCINVTILYFLTLYGIVLLEPFVDYDVVHLFSVSGWFVAPLQGLLIGLLSKLFLENPS